MKRTLFTMVAVAAIALAGCKKDSSNKPAPSSDTYLPVTKGSTWTYNDITAGNSDTRTITLTGATTQISGKTYYNVTINSVKNGTVTGYFYSANHEYTIRGSNPALAISLEFPIGVDNQNVGYSWTSLPTDNGQINGVPGKFVNSVKEKGITKEVNGRSYSNVIHTQADLQYDLGSGYTTVGAYNFYIAKGVGLIAEDFTMNGASYETETLISYSIK
ncbi:MAG: hypothetical protein JST19_11075 [Bacteroidetes bacterium]|nr:hypothetical protein [Bacteroidota bacterium]